MCRFRSFFSTNDDALMNYIDTLNSLYIRDSFSFRNVFNEYFCMIEIKGKICQGIVLQLECGSSKYAIIRFSIKILSIDKFLYRTNITALSVQIALGPTQLPVL